MAEYAESFTDLKVYQAAFRLQQDVFEASKSFPAGERYALTDQLRRASRSIGANVAEAWRKRRYVAHFTSKLTDADAEAAETLHWLDTAYACGYLDADLHHTVAEATRRVGAMLGAMLREPERWCRPARP